MKKPPRPTPARSPRQTDGGFRDMSYQHVGMDGASPFVPASMAEGRGKSSDRRVDNESLVKGEEDRLAFSKKGRPVQYTYVPCYGQLCMDVWVGSSAWMCGWAALHGCVGGWLVMGWLASVCWCAAGRVRAVG